jgi:hypothetical protein
MGPVLNAERRWDVLGKQKSLRASNCQGTKDVLKGMGPLGFLGVWGVTGFIETDSHPHHHSPKVARAPYTSPPDMGAWAWNICLISDTYHISKLSLSLWHPPSDNPLLLCKISPRSALSLDQTAFAQGQIITFM